MYIINNNLISLSNNRYLWNIVILLGRCVFIFENPRSSVMKKQNKNNVNKNKTSHVFLLHFKLSVRVCQSYLFPSYLFPHLSQQLLPPPAFGVEVIVIVIFFK